MREICLKPNKNQRNNLFLSDFSSFFFAFQRLFQGNEFRLNWLWLVSIYTWNVAQKKHTQEIS